MRKCFSEDQVHKPCTVVLSFGLLSIITWSCQESGRLQLEGIGSTIMGIALMIGMLVTPYAEEAFGSLGSRPVEHMWWEVHTKICLKGPDFQWECAGFYMFLPFNDLRVMWPLNMRYMKEHVAVALGIVAVIVVAIAVVSKRLGLKCLRGWLADVYIYIYNILNIMDILHWHHSCGIEAFFVFLSLTAHLRVFRWETASNCRRPLQIAAYGKWVFGMPNRCRLWQLDVSTLRTWKASFDIVLIPSLEGCPRFFAFVLWAYSWTRTSRYTEVMESYCRPLSNANLKHAASGARTLLSVNFSTEQANIRIFADCRRGQAPLVEAKKGLLESRRNIFIRVFTFTSQHLFRHVSVLWSQYWPVHCCWHTVGDWSFCQHIMANMQLGDTTTSHHTN